MHAASAAQPAAVSFLLEHGAACNPPQAGALNHHLPLLVIDFDFTHFTISAQALNYTVQKCVLYGGIQISLARN